MTESLVSDFGRDLGRVDTRLTSGVMFAQLRALAESNDFWLRSNLEGVTTAQALTRLGDGNSVAWIVGHIVYWRQTMLRMTGVPVIWSDGEGEGFRGASPKNAVTVDKSWDELLVAYRESQKRLIERLTAPESRGDTLPPPAESWTSLLRFLCHESYHIGQIGLGRRILGLPGAN